MEDTIYLQILETFEKDNYLTRVLRIVRTHNPEKDEWSLNVYSEADDFENIRVVLHLGRYVSLILISEKIDQLGYITRLCRGDDPNIIVIKTPKSSQEYVSAPRSSRMISLLRYIILSEKSCDDFTKTFKLSADDLLFGNYHGIIKLAVKFERIDILHFLFGVFALSETQLYKLLVYSRRHAAPKSESYISQVTS